MKTANFAKRILLTLLAVFLLSLPAFAAANHNVNVNVNSQMTEGTFSAQGDNIYFKFTVPKTGKITVTCQTMRAATSWDIVNQDLSAEYLSAEEISGSEISPTTRSYTLWLNAGIYYVRAMDKAGAADAGGKVRIKIAYTEADVTSTEPNDTFKDAMSLTSHSTVRGVLTSVDNRLDYYKITPAAGNKTTIRLLAFTGTLGFVLYNSNFEELNYVTVWANETTSKTSEITIDSPNGSPYYIKIKAYKDNNSVQGCYELTWVSEHTWNSGKVIKAATCTTSGTVVYTCTDCSETKKVTTEPLGHSYGKWTVVKAATTSSKGKKCRTCSRCNDKEYETIPKLSVSDLSTLITGQEIKTESQTSQELMNCASDKDSLDATYSLLQAKAQLVTDSSITLKWKNVKGAKKYIVYGSKCGETFKKIKTITCTTLTQNNLEAGTYYKYIVAAIGSDKNVICRSRMIYAATSGAELGNCTKITASKTSITLKAGKSTVVKATVSSMLSVKKYRGLCYESSNPMIAKVTSKGKIKGLVSGTCYIYVYAQNGLSAKIKVTVK